MCCPAGPCAYLGGDFRVRAVNLGYYNLILRPKNRITESSASEPNVGEWLAGPGTNHLPRSLGESQTLSKPPLPG